MPRLPPNLTLRRGVLGSVGVFWQTGAKPEIWSIGHRNIQGAALNARGELWGVEHGPKGGDELNVVQAGKDYGWPTISYGFEYAGGKIGQDDAGRR